MWIPHDGSAPLQEGTAEHMTCVLCHVNTQQEGGRLKGGRGSSPRAHSADISISDIQSPELREINVYCSRCPGWRFFIIAARSDKTER